MEPGVEVQLILGSKQLRRGDPASLAVAAVALVVANLHAPIAWSPDLLDTCLRLGTTLHTHCHGELPSSFVVGDARVRVCLERGLATGLSVENDINRALTRLFAIQSAGILHTSELALPVFRHWDGFYMLDPCGTLTGTASFFGCHSMSRFTKAIFRVFALNEPRLYSLSTFRLLELHFFTR